MGEFYTQRDGQMSFIKPSKEAERRAKYSYNGPVFLFDKFIATVNITTWANTPGRAHSNILYQIKDQLGYQPSVKLKIVKNQIKKEELEYGKSI